MADDLNALLEHNRSSSVLQGIMNPDVVNPLAAMSSAASVAGNIFGVRKLQAEQRVGQIATQSIDPVTRQFDPARFNEQIAAAGPDVAMAAQPGLQNASTLSESQLAQQHVKAGYIQGVIGALDDSSTPAQVNAALDRAAANGMFTPTDIANMRGHVPTNPADMPAFIQQLRLVGGSVQQQLDQRYGTNFRENVGNQIVTGTQQPPQRGGGVVPAPGGIPTTMAPGAGGTVDAVVQTEKGPVTVKIPYQQAFPGQVSPAAPPPAATPPGVPPPGTIPGTGRITPPPSLANPAKTQPPTTSAPVVETPSGPGVVTSAPVGTEQDIGAYKTAQAAMPDQQRNLVAGQAALQALQLARSGPGTGTVNAIKSFMLAQGIPGAEALDTGGVEAYQIARKNLLRFAQSNGGKVGTDLGLATQIESNPNVDSMLNNVNDHILKQDIGLARQRIAQTLTAPGQGGTGKSEFGTGMGEHVQKFTAQTDPVAFAWDLLTPEERTKHVGEVSKTEGGLEKLKRSLKIARESRVWSAPLPQPGG